MLKTFGKWSIIISYNFDSIRNMRIKILKHRWWQYFDILCFSKNKYTWQSSWDFVWRKWKGEEWRRWRRKQTRKEGAWERETEHKKEMQIFFFQSFPDSYAQLNYTFPCYSSIIQNFLCDYKGTSPPLYHYFIYIS